MEIIPENICDPLWVLRESFEHFFEIPFGYPGLLTVGVLAELLYTNQQVSTKSLSIGLTIWNQCNNSIYITLSSRSHYKSTVMRHHHGCRRVSWVYFRAKRRLMFLKYLAWHLGLLAGRTRSLEERLYSAYHKTVG